MKSIALVGIGLTLVLATTAHAAKLVVMAVNSGTGTLSNAQVPVVPGAKGFLIGIDNSADVLAPLAFQDITFHGPNLVQRQAPNTFALGILESPNVQLRNEALIANGNDPVDGSTFARNDSWWWNQAYTVGATTLTLAPVSTGIQGGLPGGPMTMTATYNPVGHVPPGIWPIAYIVATGNVLVSGILSNGQDGFDLGFGIRLRNNSTPSAATLVFEYEGFNLIPEPSTFVLAGLALGGFVVCSWMRRRKAGRLR